MHSLEISFPLEYQPPLWKHKPIKLISHFVKHKGPGSLHCYLKEKQWLTSLSCDSLALARGFDMFEITIHLTPDGFSKPPFSLGKFSSDYRILKTVNYRSVILAVHKYLALLRSAKFSRFHYEELIALSATRFRFAEREQPDSYAVSISEHMHWLLPPEFLLAGPMRKIGRAHV